MWSGRGFTLGLGEIEVNSALNQQLDADIELLSAAPEDAESLIVKLASRQAFSRAGLDRPYLLNDLRFKTVVVNGVPHIKITSKSPIREPFLNFLLEVDWPKGHVLREYTILLDPPTFMTASMPASHAAAPARSAPAGDSRPGASGMRPATVAAPLATAAGGLSAAPAQGATRAAAQPAPQRQAAAVAVVTNAPASAPGGEYRIQSGDTAWSLADAMRPDRSVTVEQMMVALLRNNPESFINENVNGLKRGYILRVPDREQIAAISPAEARALVKQQAALWREYQQGMAGGTPAPVADNAAASGMAASPAETGAADAHLQIVSAGTGASTSASGDPTQMTAAELRQALAQAREQLESERVEKEALAEQVSRLEQQLKQQQGGALSVQNSDLAQAQQVAEGGEQAAAEAAQNGMQDGMDETALAQAESPSEATDVTAAQDTTENAAATAAENATENAADNGAENNGAGEEAGQGEAGEAVFTEDATPGEQPPAQPAPDAAPVTPATPVAPVTPAPAQDPVSRLLNDPMMLAAGGGGAALLLLLLLLIIKRRKAAAEDAAPAVATASDDAASLEDIADMVEDDQLADEALAGESDEEAASEEEAEAEQVDTESTMIMEAVDTSQAPEDEDELEEEEEPRDDVIAEADVYLAYGIYQQAEELLENAIAEHPDRDDYRLKLAETHYASKNRDGFIEVAKALHEHSGDDSPAWKKVYAMGQDLCADEPLFQGSLVGGLDVDALAPKAPEMDFDLGLEEGGDDTPDLDLSLDDAALELPDLDEAATDDETTQAGESIDEAADTVAMQADELEFDLSETEAISETPAEESEAENADDILGDEEFALDIDASELDIEEAPESESAAEQEEEIEIDLSDDSAIADMEATMQVDSMDLDLDQAADESPADEAEGEQVESIEELEAALDEAESLDIDFEEETGADQAADDAEDEATVMLDSVDEAVDETVQVDLASEAVDLDFNVDEGEQTGDAETADNTADQSLGDLPEEEEFDLSSLDDVDEVSTKLDLARAYLDMGDHEGTRDILQEVLADGNEAQKKEAQELMDQLES